MNVALIHEHLAQDGGAEKVLKTFQDMFPDAPTYTLLYDRRRANACFHGKTIRTSFLQRWPLGLRAYQWYLPWMPAAVESFDLTEYDFILSSSSAFAKGVITRPDALHICYCHSPTRYLWSDTHTYVEELHYPRIVKTLVPLFLPRIRLWDQLAAQRPDVMIANSTTVRQRIEKYYRRDSTIIHPPVEIGHFRIAPDVSNYYLTGGRLVPYKRFDVAIVAFNKLGLPLKIFGAGPEERRLRKLAHANIEFCGRVSDERRAELYRHAKAFINPQEEDFGITAIEAMASGRPVIAYAKGGALDIVAPGRSGFFFHDQNWAALADTVLRSKVDELDPIVIRREAERFSTARFITRLRLFIEQKQNEFNRQHHK